ncbi:MAG: hypothetical protein ACE5J3_07635 [Methanosarcinales archaeon]
MYGKIIFEKFKYKVDPNSDMKRYIGFYPSEFIDIDTAVEIAKEFVPEKFRKRECIPRFYSASVPMLKIEVRDVNEAKEAIDICMEVSKYLQCRLSEHRIKKANEEVEEYIKKVSSNH